MPRSMITRLSIQALFIGLLTTQAVQAQKDASAILQLDSTTQGLLPPRMTAAQRDAIATPAQGLVIYNTDTNYYNYWNSTTWIPLSAGGSSTLIDADSDTQIQVEESADEDVIRFDTAGTQRVSIDSSGIHGFLADPDGNTKIHVEKNTNENMLRFDTSGVERMILRENGKIGFGINNSAYRFHLYGGASTDIMDTTIYANSTTGVMIYLGEHGDSGARIRYQADTNMLSFFHRETGVNKGPILKMYRDGNFVISDGTPQKPGGGDWSSTSDRRLKQQIKPYKEGLNKIMQINPVRFHYNGESGYDSEPEYVGIIAQDFKKILPSTITVVDDSRETGLKDKREFDGSELTYTLINAIKELNQKVKALEAQVAELERE